MSQNPYAQVALTYVRRPFSSAQVSIVVLMILGFSILGMYSVLRFDPVRNDGLRLPGIAADLQHSLMMLLPAAAWLTGLMAMHVKEQFTESRSRLTPHFRRVHLVVVAAATLFAAVVAPALVAWLAGLRSVGLVAITTALIGVVYWLVLMQSNWIPWLVTLQMLFFASETARSALALIVSGQFESQADWLLVLGVAIILLAGWHLARLNEDMPEYHRRMPIVWAAKGRMTDQNVNYDGPLPRRLADWFREHAMARLTRHVQYAARSPWSRICRWRVGMPTGWPVLLWGLLPLVFFQFVGWFLPRHTQGTVQNDMTTGMMVTQSFAFLPMMVVMPQLAGWLMIRARTMEHEVMLPVDRRAYVRQMIAAVAASYFQLCGVVLASPLLWWLVAVATPPPLGYVASVAAVALLTLVCLFGVNVFAHAVTSLRIVHMAALIVPMFGSMLLLMGGARMGNFQLLPEVLPIAAGSAALGLLLAYIAYRRWLVADFD